MLVATAIAVLADTLYNYEDSGIIYESPYIYPRSPEAYINEVQGDNYQGYVGDAPYFYIGDAPHYQGEPEQSYPGSGYENDGGHNIDAGYHPEDMGTFLHDL